MMKKGIVITISLFTIAIGMILLALYFERIWYSRPKNNIALSLTSNAFQNKQEIPQKYTCDGQNISPQLSWQTNSSGIGGYVLIIDDPDAQKTSGKTFVHWIVVLPPETTELPEGFALSLDKDIYPHGLENDFGTTYYRGPCPPPDSGEHTYKFTLFALAEDIEYAVGFNLIPKAPFTAETFRKNLKTGIKAEAQLTGKYRRK